MEMLDSYLRTLSEARRVPLYTRPMNTSLHTSTDRFSPYNSKAYPYKTRELHVPRYASILRLKKKSRLKDTSNAARQIIASHSSDSNYPAMTITTKGNGRETIEENKLEKIMTNIIPSTSTNRGNQDEMEVDIPVNLPTANILIDSNFFINFSFGTPCPSQAEVPVATATSTFKVTFPAPEKKVTEVSTASNPETVTSSLLTWSKPVTASNDPPKVDTTPIFRFDSPDRAVQQKLESKHDNPSVVVGIKEGSSNKESHCPDCWVKNKPDAIKCVCCGATNPRKSNEAPAPTTVPPINNTFGSFASSSNANWVCSECWIVNKSTAEECAACATPKPEAKSTTATSVSPPTTPFSGSNDSTFKTIAIKTQKSDKWECGECLVQNNKEKDKCACCGADKEGEKDKFGIDPKMQEAAGNKKSNPETVTSSLFTWSKPVTASNDPPKVDTTSIFRFDSPGRAVQQKLESKHENPSVVVGIKEGSSNKESHCPDCWVKNKPDAIKCVCCGAKKPSEKAKCTVSKLADSQPLKDKSVNCEKAPTQACIPLDDIGASQSSECKCKHCWVDNYDASAAKCICCGATNLKKSNEAPASTTVPPITNTFGSISSSSNAPLCDIGASQSSKWKCEECWVDNADASAAKCICCGATNPNKSNEAPALTTVPPITNTFGSIASSSNAPLDDIGASQSSKWKCEECWVDNADASAAKCICCGATNPNKSNEAPALTTVPPITNTFGSIASSSNAPLCDIGASQSSEWKCQHCWVHNDDASAAKCICCGATNPNKSNEAPASITVPPITNTFGSIASSSNANWVCSECWIVNKSTAEECAACATPKPEAKSTTATSVPPTTTPCFGSNDSTFKTIAIKTQKSDKWECGECLVQNDKEKDKCACCGADKEGEKDKFGIDPKMQEAAGNKKSYPETVTSRLFTVMPSNDNPSVVVGIKESSSNKESHCPDCWVKNKPDAIKCVCCGATNPRKSNEAPAPTTVPPINNTFGSFASSSNANWVCSECWIVNKSTAEECAACATPKPEAKSTTATSVPPTTTPCFGSNDSTFKTIAIKTQKSDKWECGECLVQNNKEKDKCACCGADKEGEKDKFGIDPKMQEAAGNKKSNPETDTSSLFTWSKPVTASNDPPKVDTTSIFRFGSPGRAVQQKLESKHENPSVVVGIKEGSSNKESQCPDCWVKNKPDAIKCVCCGAKKPSQKPSEKAKCTVSKLADSQPLKDKCVNCEKAPTQACIPLDDIGASQSSKWKCKHCWVDNYDASAAKCICCGATNPKKSNEAPASTTVPPINNTFGSIASSSNANWVCGECWIVNKSTAEECAACATPKPEAKSTTATSVSPPTTPFFGSNDSTFKTIAIKTQKSDKWECGECLVQNDKEKDKCACCGADKEGEKDKFGIDPKMQEAAGNKKSNPETVTSSLFTWSKPVTASNDPPKVDTTLIFRFGSPGRAVQQKLESKHDNPSVVVDKESSSNKESQCPDCWVKNKPDAIKCVCCGAKKPSQKPSEKAKCTVSKLADSQPLKDKSVNCEKAPTQACIPLDDIGASQSSECKCKHCWVDNYDASAAKCICCGATNLKKSNEAPASTTVPPITNTFGSISSSSNAPLCDIGASQSSKWKCEECWVDNADASAAKCICCGATNPNKSNEAPASTTAPPITNTFGSIASSSNAPLGDIGASQSSKWKCEECWVDNADASAAKCICCGATNPNKSNEAPALTTVPPITNTFGSIASSSNAPLDDIGASQSSKWKCEECWVDNADASAAKCICCGATNPNKSNEAPALTTVPPITNTFGSIASSSNAPLCDIGASQSSEWKCQHCWVDNDDASAAKCICCGATNLEKSNEAPASTTVPPITNTFGSIASSSNANWVCSECWIVNKSTAEECAACATPKPEAKSTTATSVPPTTTPCFGSNDSTFKTIAIKTQKSDKWECGECLVQNNKEKDKCACCGADKEGEKDKFGIDPKMQEAAGNKKSNPETDTSSLFTWSKPVTASNDPPKVDTTSIFRFGSPGRAVQQKLESKHENPSVVVGIKEGSSNKESQCPDCWVKNKPDAIKCVCCGAKKPSQKPSEKAKCTVSKLADSQPLKDKCVNCEKAPTQACIPLDDIGASQSSKWKCKHCWVDNYDASAAKCICCGATNPKKSNEAPASTTVPPINNTFGSIASSSNANWVCGECWIVNKSTAEECAACATPKPEAKSTTATSVSPPTTPFFGSNDSTFKTIAIKTQKSDKWECGECLVQNDKEKDKCACCGADKEGEKDKFGIDPKMQEAAGNKKSNPETVTSSLFTWSKPVTASNDPPKVDTTLIFRFGSPGRAVQQKLESKHDNPSVVVDKESSSNKESQCPDCWVKNKPDAIKCVCCGAKKPSQKPSEKAKCTVSKLADSQPLKDKSVNCEKAPTQACIPLDDIGASQSSECKCKHCWVDNDDASAAKCICCGATNLEKSNEAPASTTVPPITNTFGSIASSSNANWVCSECWIVNKSTAEECAACATPKPEAKSTTATSVPPTTTPCFGSNDSTFKTIAIVTSGGL